MASPPPRRSSSSAPRFLLSIAGFLQLQGHYLALPLTLWMLGLAAATFGFLLLNWPPAKLFMGDTGSTYLGLLIAFFALATLASGWLTLSQWLILPAAFLADSLTTLGRRLLNREPIWQAHKRHAYQALQRRFGSHRTVTLLYAAINLVVLLPAAALAGLYPHGAGRWC